MWCFVCAQILVRQSCCLLWKIPSSARLVSEVQYVFFSHLKMETLVENYAQRNRFWPAWSTVTKQLQILFLFCDCIVKLLEHIIYRWKGLQNDHSDDILHAHKFVKFHLRIQNQQHTHNKCNKVKLCTSANSKVAQGDTMTGICHFLGGLHLPLSRRLH